MPDNAVSRVQVDTQVHRLIRDRVLSGSLPPGTRLVQEALAAEFGVSRIPVRDALRRLIAEGVLEQGRQGAMVTATSPREVEDIYQLRERIEGLAARRCAERRPNDAGSAMAAVLAVMAANAREGRHLENVRLDYEFHSLLYRFAGSDTFARAAHLLWSGFAPNAAAWIEGRTLGRAERASLRRSEAEHRTIVMAVREGDGEAAEVAATMHVRNARLAIAGQIQSTGEGGHE